MHHTAPIAPHRHDTDKNSNLWFRIWGAQPGSASLSPHQRPFSITSPPHPRIHLSNTKPTQRTSPQHPHTAIRETAACHLHTLLLPHLPPSPPSPFFPPSSFRVHAHLHPLVEATICLFLPAAAAALPHLPRAASSSTDSSRSKSQHTSMRPPPPRNPRSGATTNEGSSP